MPFFSCFFCWISKILVEPKFLEARFSWDQNFRPNRSENKPTLQRNWVFATNSHFLIPLSLQPDKFDPLIFKTIYSVRSKNLSLKYQKSTPSVCKDKRIRKLSLWQNLNYFDLDQGTIEMFRKTDISWMSLATIPAGRNQ